MLPLVKLWHQTDALALLHFMNGWSENHPCLRFIWTVSQYMHVYTRIKMHYIHVPLWLFFLVDLVWLHCSDDTNDLLLSWTMSQVEQTNYYRKVLVVFYLHSNKLSPSLKPPTQNMPMPGGMNQSGPPPQAPHGHNMPSEGPPAPHMQNQMNGQMPGKTQGLCSVA